MGRVETSGICGDPSEKTQHRHNSLIVQPNPRHPAVAEFTGLGEGGERTAIKGAVDDTVLKILETLKCRRHFGPELMEVGQEFTYTESLLVVGDAFCTQDSLVLVVLLEDTRVVLNLQNGPRLIGVIDGCAGFFEARLFFLSKDRGDGLGRQKTAIEVNVALKELCYGICGTEDEVVAHLHLGDGPLIVKAYIVTLLVAEKGKDPICPTISHSPDVALFEAISNQL